MASVWIKPDIVSDEIVSDVVTSMACPAQKVEESGPQKLVPKSSKTSSSIRDW
jgi:hypothetical protein